MQNNRQFFSERIKEHHSVDSYTGLDRNSNGNKCVRVADGPLNKPWCKYKDTFSAVPLS